MRAAPRSDLAYQGVQQLAAVAGIESRRGLLELVGAQAPARKGAERTHRLVGEHARAAAHLALRLLEIDAWGAAVFARFQLPGSEDQVAIAWIVRRLDRRKRNAGNERAGREVAVLVPGRMREHHLGRRGLPLVGDAPVERERGFGARLRDAGLLLQRDRDAGIGMRIARPHLVGEARHPEAVEALALRLDHAADLARGVGGFGL